MRLHKSAIPIMIGSLIIDKPAGLTSHDVVARVRLAAATRRVGHAGTLDPFATGVLVVCLGRATRLVQFLAGLDKEYIATVRLGFATDTQDLTGKQITPGKSSNELSVGDVRRTVNELTGPLLQLPPMFSAKKVGGERLYRAAREGREIERKPVPITVHSIDLVDVNGAYLSANEDGTSDFLMRVRCSSGTYIRTLAHDIGNRLGPGAHLAALRRTAVGQFRVERARGLEEIETLGREGALERCVVNPSETISHLHLVSLDDERVGRVLNGRELGITENEADHLGAGKKPVRLCDGAGSLVAVGEYDDAQRIVKPRVVIHDKV
jgi:tRNA pseudouridine55 synthase